MAMVTGFFWETRWLSLRTLRRFYRVPANSFGVVLFPLIQLFVFSQMFKDIVQLPGFAGQKSYLEYLAPGQIVFTVFFATAWSGGNLLYDYRNGMLDKLRVSPVNRYSILAGELAPLFIECLVMGGAILALSVLLGAHVATGVAGAAMILLLAGALGAAWSGTSFLPALITKSEQATSLLSVLFFPVAFMSTAFVPIQLMPEWLQALNRWNPLSYVIEAMRSLMATGWDWNLIGQAFVAIVLLALILHTATLWTFRRLTS